MSFELSPELDRNKVFLVNRSELEGRLDTVFYHPKHMANEDAIKSSKWGYDKVSHIADRIVDGPFGSDLKVNEYQPEGNPLLRVSNIRTGEVEGDLVYISDEKQNQLKRSKVYPNDVLLTKAGAILGYSAVFPESMKEGNITSHLVTITCRDDIDPHYLSHFFRSNIGQLQIYRWGNKSTRPELNTGEVESILVTTPPPHIQAEIVRKMDAAYSAKKQKEAEAQKLLDSIDDYLLGELSIDLPKQVENTIQSRMFMRRLSEVSGGRFDSPVHKKKYILESKQFPMKKFSDCVLINPLTSFYGHSSQTAATFIPMEKVSDQYGEADISESRNIEESGGYTKFQENDLIWAKITPCMQNGKSAVVTHLQNGIGFGSTEFHVFRAKSNTEISYIHGLLRLSSLRKHAVLYFSGSAGHQRVADDFFKRLCIPLPPIDKQTEIADHITTVRDQAKALQQQAKADLEQAKKEVEAMILGEDENKA